jgi:hypothetical protein
MSKSNLKLAEAPPPRTPERQRLAEAIEAHAAAVKQVQHVQERHEHAEQVVFRASDKLEAAQRASEKAKASESERIASAALGEADTDLMSVTDAELAVAQATNDLTVSRRIRDALQERLAREKAEVTRAKEAIERAVAAAAKSDPPAVALVLEQERVNRRLAELHHIFSFLGRSDASPVSNYGFWPNAASAAVVDPWRAALEALRTDPDAPLPTEPLLRPQCPAAQSAA